MAQLTRVNSNGIASAPMTVELALLKMNTEHSRCMVVLTTIDLHLYGKDQLKPLLSSIEHVVGFDDGDAASDGCVMSPQVPSLLRKSIISGVLKYSALRIGSKTFGDRYDLLLFLQRGVFITCFPLSDIFHN